MVLIGEDIESPYGGAFKATKGLSDAFPGRIRNTPISEALIVGLGNGLALAGLRPVCEIMFGDFPHACRRPMAQPCGQVPLHVQRASPGAADPPYAHGRTPRLRPDA